MGITDELRYFANEWDWLDYKADESARRLRTIADRIDAEHEETIQQALMGVGGVPATDENMAELGWVRLPKDADGVPIHMGDVMEGADKYDSLKKVRGKVITISFESDGIVDVAIKAWNSDGRSWHRAYLDPDASVYRHYHAPTVEDVLTEFGIDWEHESDCEDRAALLKEFAAKLRLAEGEDA